MAEKRDVEMLLVENASEGLTPQQIRGRIGDEGVFHFGPWLSGLKRSGLAEKRDDRWYPTGKLIGRYAVTEPTEPNAPAPTDTGDEGHRPDADEEGSSDGPDRSLGDSPDEVSPAAEEPPQEEEPEWGGINVNVEHDPLSLTSVYDVIIHPRQGHSYSLPTWESLHFRITHQDTPIDNPRALVIRGVREIQVIYEKPQGGTGQQEIRIEMFEKVVLTPL